MTWNEYLTLVSRGDLSPAILAAVALDDRADEVPLERDVTREYSGEYVRAVRNFFRDLADALESVPRSR